MEAQWMKEVEKTEIAMPQMAKLSSGKTTRKGNQVRKHKINNKAI
jgi:hypothetical protein